MASRLSVQITGLFVICIIHLVGSVSIGYIAFYLMETRRMGWEAWAVYWIGMLHNQYKKKEEPSGE